MTDLDGLTRLQADLAIPNETYERISDALLNRGQSVGQFLGLDPEDRETIHQVARQTYESGGYAVAEQMFGLLCLLDGSTFAYWLGLGNCRQMLDRHGEAQAAYRMAAARDSQDPRPHLQSAVSWIALGERGPALEALNAALARVETWSSDPTAIRERAATLQQWIDAPEESGGAESHG